LWRKSKLLGNILTTALVFNYFITVLILLLNPQVSLSLPDFIALYLNLLVFYGPLWTVLVAFLFFVIQFFAEKKYQIGIVSPPTITYFLSFTILVITFVMYLNYDFYFEFLASGLKSHFIKILLTNLTLIITSIVFLVVKPSIKKWAQVPFFLILSFSMIMAFNSTVADRYPLFETAPDMSPRHQPVPRKIRIVIMDGLSLNFLYSLSADGSLMNINHLLKNGIHGRITTYRPNFYLALLNSALSGKPPSDFRYRSEDRCKFSDLPQEFDTFPRYVFFRYSSTLTPGDFFEKKQPQIQDRIARQYKRQHLRTVQIFNPVYKPVYNRKKLARNGLFIHLFSKILEEPDEKFELVRKSFFLDEFLKTHIPDFKTTDVYYSVNRLHGLDTITKYFYQYYMSTIFANIPRDQIDTYGWIFHKYYEYYDAVIGNLISSTGDNELLVLLSLYEYEPLPVWRRILVNLLGRQGIYVFKSLNSRGTILMFEKNALKKDYPLESVSVYDIYPTLIYYAGLQLSEELQGEVIRDIFTDEFILNNPIDIRTH